MSDKKLIAVIGATGAQGGGLVRAILENPEGEFRVRAITRDQNSEKAKALAAAGAEVVEADLDDPASLERAFSGAYGAYGVTNFWEHFSPEKELEQAGNLAQAAKAAGIQHFIWSTLEDTRKKVSLESDQMPTLQSKYKVPHFDAKGEADALFAEAGVPTTFLLTSFYWDNLIHFGMGPQRGPDGNLAIAFPMDDAKLPGIAGDDIGRAAYGIFKRGVEFVGKTIGIAGEHLSGSEMAEKLSAAVGQPVGFYRITPEAYRALGFPGADDLGNMFQFKRDFEPEFRSARSVEFTRQLHPAVKSFDAWLNQNKAAIAIP